MPNITAHKKSMRQSTRRRLVNDRRRRAMRQAIKNLQALVKGKKTDEIAGQLSTVYKTLDKAAKGGVIKKNTAARKKSRLSAFAKTAQ